MTYFGYRLPHWTSPQTFGDPQGAILVVLVAVLGLFAAMSLYTIARELGSRRRKS